MSENLVLRLSEAISPLLSYAFMAHGTSLFLLEVKLVKISVMMDTKLVVLISWNVVVCRSTAIQLVENSKPDTCDIRHNFEKSKCAGCVLQ